MLFSLWRLFYEKGEGEEGEEGVEEKEEKGEKEEEERELDLEDLGIPGCCQLNLKFPDVTDRGRGSTF